MDQKAMSLIPAAKLSRAWLAAPAVAFALVSLTVGLLAKQTLRSPYATPFFHFFFSDILHMKIWLATLALAELEDVFTFIYSRVGNRKDAEVLTLQVALKALPCLRRAGAASAIRGSLFATARIALAEFWSARLNVAKDELLGDPDYCVPESAPPDDSGEVVP